MSDLEPLLAASIKIKDLDRQAALLFASLLMIVECKDCVCCEECSQNAKESIEHVRNFKKGG